MFAKLFVVKYGLDWSQRILITAIGEMRDSCISLEVDVR